MFDPRENSIKFLVLVLVWMVYVSGCIEREREALLRFKQELRDESGALSSWGSEGECCSWLAVECSNTTGHVTGLLLYGTPPGFDDFHKFGGQISSALLELQNLNYLDLSWNDFEGIPIPDFIGSFKTLEFLYIIDSNFSGRIPSQLGNLTNLRRLELGFNRLIGSVPASLGQLSKLQHLDFSFNSLEGTISEAHLMDLHNLHTLVLSSNSLTINLSPDWVPPFQLERIDLASCIMGPSFPTWLRTQSQFRFLDISVAGISDEVPKWLCNLSAADENIYLNLSHNQISGTIPDLSSSSSIFSIPDIGYNKLSGPVPLLQPETRVFQLSFNMFSGSISSICPYAYCKLSWLDLSNNQLTGELPNDWENMKELVIINVNYNNLSGEIPQTLGSLWNLQTLHLRFNNFSGELPSTLKKCGLLQQIDIGGNRLTGNIPPWLGENHTSLAFLSLRQNRFYGGIPPELCKLTQIQLLDLSENDITGKIPECFDNFTALVEKNGTTTTRIPIRGIATNGYIDYALVQWKGQESEYTKTLGLLKLIDLSSNGLVGSIPKSFSNLRELISLNLSRNSLTGNIIPDIGKMEALETLDLSRNQFSGEIPISLAQLNFLGVLNLANNNLTGKIPISTQLQGFNASAYAGNNGLCGLPLPFCPNTSIATDQGTNKDGGFMGLSSSPLEICISLALGFIVGFWGVVASLVLKRSWRNAYFNLLDAVGDWLCAATTMFLTKLRRR